MPILASSLEVLQAAMPMVGAKPPASMDDQTPEAIAARAYYEIMVKKNLNRHAWSWATKSAVLTYSGETGEIPAYAYALPADVLTPRRIEVQGRLFKDWELRAGRVLCNMFDSDQLILIYNCRAPEALWDAHFVDATIHEMAGHLAMGLLDRPQQGDALKQRAEGLIRRAIRMDRRSHPPGDANPDPVLLRAWRGGAVDNTEARLHFATDT